MPNNDSYYLKYSTDNMRIHSNVGFYFGAKAAQNATDKTACLNLPEKVKLNEKGKTC